MDLHARTLTCTRSDALLPFGVFTINVTVDFAKNAPANGSVGETVSGGGDGNSANNTNSQSSYYPADAKHWFCWTTDGQRRNTGHLFDHSEPVDDCRPRHHELQRIAGRLNLHFYPCNRACRSWRCGSYPDD